MMKKANRNMKHKPWTPMIPFQVPPEAAASRVVAAFQNHRATVFIKETVSPAFTDPAGQPQKMAHLMIQWAKGLRGTDEFFYRMKQKVKSELCGEQSEFVELGPGEWREQDLQQTHLWVLPQGATYPIGLVPSDIEGKMAEMAGGRENVVMKEELELFVVRHPGAGPDGEELVEVFLDQAECEAMYGESKIPESSVSGVELIGDIPTESPSTAWTEAAKKKLAGVLSKGKIFEREATEQAPQLFYDKNTVEDEIWSDAVDDSPSSLEEHLAIASAMEEAAGERENEKVTMLRQITEEVIGRAADNVDLAKKAAEKPRIITP